MEYGWRDGARNRRLKIATVAPVLERIEARHGALTPGAVVREASKKSSPLHTWFEWDDTEAARLFRLEQARDLIRSVTVTITGGDDEELTVRAFVHVSEDESEYENIASVMRTPEKKARLMEMARRDMAAFVQKYRDLEAVATVIAAIARVRKAA